VSKAFLKSTKQQKRLVLVLWNSSAMILKVTRWSTVEADIVGKYFLFLQIFFFGEEKRGSRHSRNFWYISVKNLQKQVVYLSSSQKNTQVEKKNRLKRSPGSQDIEVLKSAIFQGFFRGRRHVFFFFSVAAGG
jgi:hypothetical protein